MRWVLPTSMLSPRSGRSTRGFGFGENKVVVTKFEEEEGEGATLSGMTVRVVSTLPSSLTQIQLVAFINHLSFT